MNVITNTKGSWLLMPLLFLFQLSWAQNIALELDGDDHLSLSSGSINLNDDYTIEGFFYSSSAAAQTIFDAFPSGNPGSNIYVELNGGELRFLHRSPASTGGPTELNSTSGTSLLGSWNHFAAVRQGTDLRLYLNNVLVDSDSDADDVSGGVTFEIGRNHNTLTRYFTGQLEEIRVWDVARTAYEIRSGSDCQIDYEDESLLVYYNFQEGPLGPATTIEDMAGGDQDATATGDPQYVSPNPGLVLGTCPVLQPSQDGQVRFIEHDCDEVMTLFYDSGGQPWNYIETNDDQTVTTTTVICPSEPSCQKISGEFFGDLYIAPGDVLTVYDGSTNTDPEIWSSTMEGYRFMRKLEANPQEATNPAGCLTFEFTTNGDGKSAEGWGFKILCTPRNANLVCPNEGMVMLFGEFEEDDGECEIVGMYVLPAPTFAEDADYIDPTKVDYSIDIENIPAGLTVDPLVGLQPGDKITVTATTAEAVGQSFDIVYSASCTDDPTLILGSCTLMVQFLAPNMICAAEKNTTLGAYCKTWIRPEDFLKQTCGLFTYTLEVKDDLGKTIAGPEAEFVEITEAGDYEIIISDGTNILHCEISVADNRGLTCETELPDKFALCSEELTETALDVFFDIPTIIDCRGEQTPIPDTEVLEICNEDDPAILPDPGSDFILDKDRNVYVGTGDQEGFEILKAFRRSWKAVDVEGEEQLVDCDQILYVTRPVYDAQYFKVDDITISCGESLTDIPDEQKPYAQVGETIIPLAHGACQYSVEADPVRLLKGGENCDGGIVIYTRRYRISDCCDLTRKPYIEIDQTISVEIVAPEIVDCEEGLLITADVVLDTDETCRTTISLSSPIVVNSCVETEITADIINDVDVVVATVPIVDGMIDNFIVEGLLEGSYTLEISASNCVGQTLCTRPIEIKNISGPIIDCSGIPDITKSIGLDLSVDLLEADFLQGLIVKTCGATPAVDLRFRIAGSGDNFTDLLSFDCDDLGLQQIEVRAYNASLGVGTEVAADIGPFDSCLKDVTINDILSNCVNAVCKDNPSFNLVENLLTNEFEYKITLADLDGGSLGDEIKLFDNNDVEISGSKTFTCDDILKTFDYKIVATTGLTQDECQVSFTIVDADDPVITTPPLVTYSKNVSIGTTPVTFDGSTRISGLNAEDNCGLFGLSLVYKDPEASDPDAIIPSYEFNCSMVGDFKVLKVGVQDESGNVSLFYDLVIGCVSNLIEGRIAGADGLGLSNVTLNLEGEKRFIVVTDEEGKFKFEEAPPGGSFLLRPEKDIHLLNGVSTYDIILASQHILGTNEFTSPYQYIAADVNHDGKVSVMDIVQIRQVILNIMNHFPGNKSWRFVDGDYRFPAQVDPLHSGFPEAYQISELKENMKINFVGIKVGDINGDAHPADQPGSSTRSDRPDLVLTTINRWMERGENYDIPVTAANFAEVLGYQFTIDFDPGALQFNGWTPGALQGLSENNFGLRQTEEGLINTSWTNDDRQQLDPDEVLFYLHFTALENTALDKTLSLSSRGIQAEAYRGANISHSEFLNVSLEFEDLHTDTDFSLYQNQPNPFATATAIAFSLPQAGEVQLSVFDMAGRLILQRQIAAAKGYNETQLSASELSEGGVYYYRLDAPGGSATRKMILIK